MARTETRAGLAVSLLLASTLHGDASPIEVRPAASEVKPTRTYAQPKAEQPQKLTKGTQPKRTFLDYLLIGISSATTRHTTRGQMYLVATESTNQPDTVAAEVAPTVIPVFELEFQQPTPYHESATLPESQQTAPSWPVETTSSRRTSKIIGRQPEAFRHLKQPGRRSEHGQRGHLPRGRGGNKV